MHVHKTTLIQAHTRLKIKNKKVTGHNGIIAKIVLLYQLIKIASRSRQIQTTAVLRVFTKLRQYRFGPPVGVNEASLQYKM